VGDPKPNNNDSSKVGKNYSSARQKGKIGKLIKKMENFMEIELLADSDSGIL